ncbi:MAG: hypothetical protein IJP82_07900 [Bacteroidaceae bacterium]|nr:hypothetical protein [Bacteroidaceae bacterium]
MDNVNYIDKVQQEETASRVEEPVMDAYVAEAPKSQISLDGLWVMLHTLDVDSKRWLINRLSEDIKPTKTLKAHHKHALSDAELEAELSQFPLWEEVQHTDLSDVDYRKVEKALGGVTIKEPRKWL